MVCHLCCSLYGLKQAPCAWFERFAYVVTDASFLTSAHDPPLYVHLSARGQTLLYVGDMIITRNDPQYIAFVRRVLVSSFLFLILAHVPALNNIQLHSHLLLCNKRLE